MFVRVRQSRSKLQFSLVETRRAAGAVRHEHVAALGSVGAAPSPADRIAFWARLHQRLAALSNRVGLEDQGKVLAAVHARVPMPMVDDQRDLQLENAKVDAKVWDMVADANADLAADHKKLAASAERAAAEATARAADARKQAQASKERVAKI